MRIAVNNKLLIIILFLFAGIFSITVGILPFWMISNQGTNINVIPDVINNSDDKIIILFSLVIPIVLGVFSIIGIFIMMLKPDRIIIYILINIVLYSVFVIVNFIITYDLHLTTMSLIILIYMYNLSRRSIKEKEMK